MTKPPRHPRSKPLLRADGEPLQSRPIKKRNPAQPALPFDPMPLRVEPALALLKQKPPSGEQWFWEIKWDGYRLAIHAEPATSCATWVALEPDSKSGLRSNLRAMMDKLSWRRRAPPVTYLGKRRVVWVQPRLIAEIKFRQWTPNMNLRHAACKGLREVQDDAEVYRL